MDIFKKVSKRLIEDLINERTCLPVQFSQIFHDFDFKVFVREFESENEQKRSIYHYFIFIKIYKGTFVFNTAIA